jgi:molecular chaperone DnaJ
MTDKVDMDPHAILGVVPEAGINELKRAYRRLAMQWHPDRNAHPEATERFKQIRAAYDALLNRDDGDVAVDTGEQEESGSNASQASTSQAKAADIHLDLSLSLEEAAAGCDKTIVVERGTDCLTCAGSGESGISKTRFCSVCHGSGRVRHRTHGLERCHHCNGRGLFTERICPDCAGTGRDTDAVSLRVVVPAGMVPGSELRLSGQGEPGGDDCLPGDLYLRLLVQPHPVFTCVGADIEVKLSINAFRLLAGGQIMIPTLAGLESFELAAGSATPRRVVVARRGYPMNRGRQTGDLILHLEPQFPEHLTSRQKKLLKQLADDFDG